MTAILFIICAATIVVPIVCAQECPNGYRPSTVVANKCFRIYAEMKSFYDAQVYCQNVTLGANMLSISSAFENGDIYGK